MRLRKGLLAAVLVTAAFPASAAAAEFSGELSANTPEFAWEGVGTGIPLSAVHIITDEIGQDNPFACGTPGHDCDHAKLNVVHPGTLELTLDFTEGGQDVAGTAGYPDLDAAIYKAGPDGKPEGESLTGTDCGGSKLVENCKTESLKPGAYVVEVSFFLADESPYKAKVVLDTPVEPTPPAPPAPAESKPADPGPAPAPAPGQQQQPQQQQQGAPHNAEQPKPASKKKSKKAACKKKAKKIKNKGKRRKALKRCARMR